MQDLLDGVQLAGMEIFAMLIAWIFVVAAVVTIAGVLCLLTAAAIRFAVRELRSKGLSQAPAHSIEESA